MNVELSHSAVNGAISTKWLGRSYTYFPTIGSTNDKLEEMVTSGNPYTLPAGAVFLADFQSQGRGRLNRQWIAPPGTSLLLSILFRPNWPGEKNHWLTMIACLAASDAVESVTELKLKVKWPNDLVIYVTDTWCKVGGLLLSGEVGESGRLESAILGIGLNVNIPTDQLPEAITPATSLLAASGKPVSRLDFLVNFLERLEMHYEAADAGQSPQPAWKRRLVTLGQLVQVTDINNAVTTEGKAEDTDEYGHLLVRDDMGQMHTIAAGDVTLRTDQPRDRQ